MPEEKILEELKVENERLKTKLKDAREVIIDLKNAITVNAINRKAELAEARKEERERAIDECIASIENVYEKFPLALNYEEDARYNYPDRQSGISDALEHLKAIEPQQPKSCEGCKHLKHNLSIGAAYCTKPCNDYSHYQPKEK